jgi:hypothetical protein
MPIGAGLAVSPCRRRWTCRERGTKCRVERRPSGSLRRIYLIKSGRMGWTAGTLQRKGTQWTERLRPCRAGRRGIAVRTRRGWGPEALGKMLDTHSPGYPGTTIRPSPGKSGTAPVSCRDCSAAYR